MSPTPFLTLTLRFWAWKLLLSLVALASPGPSYDTSTDVLLHPLTTAGRSAVGFDEDEDSWTAFALLRRLATRHLRWDAVYFVSAAARGTYWEQEWAFSRPLAAGIGFVGRSLPSLSPTTSLYQHTLAGMLISTLMHYLSVLVLYALTQRLLAPHPRITKRSVHEVAQLTASLHVITPGGLFLSAPYGESMFALANFLACYFYIRAGTASSREQSIAAASGQLLVSGVFFGAATLVRSNGILGGLLFLWDALLAVPMLWSLVRRPLSIRAHLPQVLRLGVTLLSGMIIFVAYVAPQVVAYREYCTGGRTRPWCARWLPSIYTFVQTHYWNVGFGRYWTVSNIPLFLLATPMLVVLVTTGVVALSRYGQESPEHESLAGILQTSDMKSSASKTDPSVSERHITEVAKMATVEFRTLLARLALPQLLLAVLAATSFHVQIINRIASGYPVWYIVLALAVVAQKANPREEVGKSQTKASAAPHTIEGRVMRGLTRSAQWIVRGMMIYGIVHGGLYASFLPPA